MKKQLARLAHEQWSGWMKYMFNKGVFNTDGTWTMPKWAVNRWIHQMNLKYEDLADDEQNSDKKEADKFMVVFEQKFKELKIELAVVRRKLNKH